MRDSWLGSSVCVCVHVALWLNIVKYVISWDNVFDKHQSTYIIDIYIYIDIFVYILCTYIYFYRWWFETFLLMFTQKLGEASNFD